MTFARMFSVALAFWLSFSTLNADSTDAALDRFRKDLARLHSAQEKKADEVKGNSLAGYVVLRSMTADIKAVRTDDLPDDLNRDGEGIRVPEYWWRCRSAK